MLQRIARLAIAAPRRIIAVGVLVFIAAAVFGIPVAKSLSPGGFQDPNSESAHAIAVLRDKFGQSGQQMLILVTAPGGAGSEQARKVGAYLVDTVVPAVDYGPGAPVPACARRDEAGCVVAWVSVPRGEFGKASEIVRRARVWNDRGRLVSLAGRAPLCVNPLLGAQTDAEAPPRLNLGAANATGLEWGVRPGFMARQVGAQCVDGVLRVSRARSASLRPSGDWIDRLRPHGYNLFWADLEADAKARASAWAGRPG